VRFIRGNVIFYSIYYIERGKYNIRFLVLLVLFILSIIFFISSPRIVRIFLGWDGLGLVSYLLVNFYGNKRSLNSGMLTVLRNRLGDVFLLIGIYIRVLIGGWKFLVWDNYRRLWIFILARFTKRAQLPFSSWLPFAIAAPTPVSSLVHSSTLVTAGVFLIFRMFYLINRVNLSLIYSTGILTMFVSRICGVFETDLKKVIALSTLSQLGVIIVILGLGFKDFCFFHLIVHALFKSRLFMRIGCKIHEYSNLQDSRVLSQNWKNRIINFFFGVTNLALVGFPFLSGFFSKDFRLEFMLSNNLNFFLRFSFVLRVMLTVAYRFKFIILGRLKFSNFVYTIGYNYVYKIVFYRLIFLLILRVIFGFAYFYLFFDCFMITDMVRVIKISITIFLYFLVLFLYNYLLKKNIVYNKFVRFYIFLFFLRQLTRSFKKILKNYVWYFKLVDRGYLDIVKCTRLIINFTKLSAYTELAVFFRRFMFILILIYGISDF